MILGNFRKAGENFTGRIKTLTLDMDVSIERIHKFTAAAPDFLIVAASGERVQQIGVAWERFSDAGKMFLIAKIEYPAISIQCSLCEIKSGTYALIWEP